MPKPVICFDMDGTLIDHAGKIHPADANLLACLPEDAVFILATGRALDSVKETFTRLGLFAGKPLPLPLVLQNGALLYGQFEQLLAHFAFTSQDQPGLFALGPAFPDVTFLFMDQHAIHLVNPTPFGQAAVEKYHLKVQQFTNASQGESFSKVMCLSTDRSRLSQVAARCTMLPVAGAYSMPEIYELAPQRINKGFGLEQLMTRLGLSGSPRFIAGDGGNDVDMLALADVAFAPLTAAPEIQAQVHRVIDIHQLGLLAPMLAAAGLG